MPAYLNCCNFYNSYLLASASLACQAVKEKCEAAGVSASQDAADCGSILQFVIVTTEWPHKVPGPQSAA